MFSSKIKNLTELLTVVTHALLQYDVACNSQTASKIAVAIGNHPYIVCIKRQTYS